jgi:hypothetical protein
MKFDGRPLGDATAFIVRTSRGPLLLTNRHNFTGRHQDTGDLISTTGGIPNEVTIFHNAQDRLGSWVPRTESLLSSEQPLWLEHPTLGSSADFVALPLTSLVGVAVYPYDPARPGPLILVEPSDVVSVVGFPFGKSTGGKFAIWATGFVASEIEIPSDPTFLIDCRSRQGQSGSPVIAYRSAGMIPHTGGINITGAPSTRFIGIYSGRINRESDLGIVWKARVIDELVKHYESLASPSTFAHRSGQIPVYVRPTYRQIPVP